MAHEITVPRLGWTMEEGTFGGWLKADGDTVREGDELFVLESDKCERGGHGPDAGILRIGGGPRQGDVVKAAPPRLRRCSGRGDAGSGNRRIC